jgi:hypothetical protein
MFKLPVICYLNGVIIILIVIIIKIIFSGAYMFILDSFYI